jgi:L,D-transpeptidase catalytic domain/Putative peptidoglycan binding domain
VQNAPADLSFAPGEAMMGFNRRDMFKGTAAFATAESLTLLVGAGAAAAATRSTLRMGSRGPQVLAMQRRLTSLGYWLGAPDGQFGDLTRQAVVTIQKVGALLRNGECGPLTWSRLDAGIRPRARSAKGHVIEVNKATQTLLIVDSGVVKRIYNTSTGSNQRYFSEGKWQVALTPSGSFRVFRHVNSWDSGPLGKLYRPKYFNGGIAIHGYSSVPSTPASHGCCRVSLPAMDNLWGAGGLQLGTAVLVY